MTDRFYPLGLPAEEDVWKSTYSVQSEMRSYERSAYPPGTSIHLPGSRDKFGFSTPGPHAHRLCKPDLALTEDTDVANPRVHHAIPRMQAPDDRVTFEHFDVPEMRRSYKSPLATMSLSGGDMANLSKMSKSRSLPSFERKTVPPRVSMKLRPEPRRQDWGRISMSMFGEGTGFRTQTAVCNWWPEGRYDKLQATGHRESFQAPPFHRTSPSELLLTQASQSAYDWGGQ